MPKLLIAFASATLLLAGSGVWKANAATVASAGTLAPLTKSYAPAEKVAYRHRYARRAYRRGYYGYGYRPYYGYGYRAYPYYGYGYRPYGYYGYGWRPGITIGIGPIGIGGWGWRY
jgi:hypothetical protein